MEAHETNDQTPGDVYKRQVESLVRHIPRPVGLFLLAVFLVLAVVDVSATVAAMVGLNKHLRQLDEMAARIKQASNELGENLADATLNLSLIHISSWM